MGSVDPLGDIVFNRIAMIIVKMLTTTDAFRIRGEETHILRFSSVTVVSVVDTIRGVVSI